MKSYKVLIASLALIFGLSACATDDFGNRRPLSDTSKGALIGGGGGAALGALIGGKKNRGKGALIGAIGGALAGGAVGNYMDRQNQDLEKALANEINAGVIEISRLPQDQLRITMTGQSAFNSGSSAINPAFTSTMDKLASVINRYGKTTLDIVGHTDSDGSTAANQTLSDQRAQAVAQYFAQDGVHPSRLSAAGRGESEPRATNNTPEGKQLNRRVEITVSPVVEAG